MSSSPLRFSCDRCGRVYSVSGDLSGRSFRMKCKACGHVIHVRGESKGSPAAHGPDEPVRATITGTSKTGTFSISVPAPAPDENPFETQPISIASVRAALEADGHKKPAEAAPGTAPGLPPPPGEGYIDLVFDEEDRPGDATPSEPIPWPAWTPPPLPAQLPGRKGGGESLEDPFADWEPEEKKRSAVALAESSPAAASPRPPVPVARRPLPSPYRAARPRRRGWLIVSIAAAVVAAVAAAVYFFVLPSRATPSAEAGSPAPPRPPASVLPAPEAGAAAAPAQVEPAAVPEGEKETRRAADERRAKDRRPRVAREELRAGPPAPAPAPPATAPFPATEGRGPPPPQQVARVVNASRRVFESCIAEAVKRDPSLGGRNVTLRMTVQPSGRVNYPTLDDVELAKTDLGTCLKAAARGIVFPRFAGDPFSVEVPLSLTRAP